MQSERFLPTGEKYLMENEGLEALKDIKSKPFSWEKLKDSLDIIEKELKAKDNLASMCEKLAELVGLKEKDYVELETLITKKLKALNEIVALHDKWLGYEMSDFEFFTLLNDIKYKYGLENEVLK